MTDRKMRFLFKYPSRGRPEWFQETLTTYFQMLSGEHSYRFIIALDTDDACMHTPEMKKFLSKQPNTTVHVADHKSKVEACNSAMPSPSDFDIVVLVSDDMIPQKEGFDRRLARDMLGCFPEMDGIIGYPDGCRPANDNLVTWTVMGSGFYKRYGFLYNPAYHSLWCDNELTDLARQWGKLAVGEPGIVRHMWRSRGMDTTYADSENDNERDKLVYLDRREKGFPPYALAE